MAELSLHHLPQHIIMAQERFLDFELSNSSFNQWHTSPLLAAINFNPFGPSSSTPVFSAVDQVTFYSDWFSDSGWGPDRDEIFSSERFRAFNGYGPGLVWAWNPSSDTVNEHGSWGFENEDFNGMYYVEDLGVTVRMEPGISISDSDSDVRDVDSSIRGLLIGGMDWESDSDAEEQIVAIIEQSSGGNGENNSNWVENANNLRNGFGLQEQINVHEDFEWEEVEDRAGQRENQYVVADGLEELPEASGIPREQARRLEVALILEWEFLLGINDHPIDAMVEHGIDRLYFLADENPFDYDALVAQFVDDDNTFRGSPPASRSVVENLPLVELKTEDLKDDKVACSICKDDIPLEEKAKKLPCSHYYHEDCILPWLNIRNTCPACRYELPTDDPEYERSKTQRSRAG